MAHQMHTDNDHIHVHPRGCGHTGVQHEDHAVYLHGGHLHHHHKDHFDEHPIRVSGVNPDDCTVGHECDGHGAGNAHGPHSGHEPVPHGDIWITWWPDICIIPMAGIATTMDSPTDEMMTETLQPENERAAARGTRQRRAIRSAFLGTDRPLDPTEVLVLAVAGHSGLGIATVYRKIKALLEEGWLTAVELAGEVTQNELAGKEHHHHFRWRTRGKVFEMNACLPNVQKLAPQGFQVSGHDLLLYGACRGCAPAWDYETWIRGG